MKTNFFKKKQFLILILFVNLFLFYSCSQDEYEPIVTEETTISDLEIENNPATTKSGNVQGVAWAWYSGFGTPSDYQYNQGQGTITINRISTGRYRVVFPNRASLNGGIVHTSAYGGNHSMQVQGWFATARGLEASIHSFDPNGNYVDGKFVVLLYKKKRLFATLSNDAYMLSHIDSISTAPDPSFRKYNSRNGQNTVTRINKGTYYVQFNDLEVGNINYSDGSQRRFQVTPYGNTLIRAKISYNFQGNNGANAFITTLDNNGNRADAPFIIGYNQFAGLVPPVSFNSRAIHYTGSSVIPTNSDITVTYSGNGRYAIKMPVRNSHTTTSTVLVSSYGNESIYTNISGWYRVGGFIHIRLQSYNPDGTPITEDIAQFNVLYLDDH